MSELLPGLDGTFKVISVKENVRTFKTSDKNIEMFCHDVEFGIDGVEYPGQICSQANSVGFLAGDSIHVKVKSKNQVSGKYQLHLHEIIPAGTVAKIYEESEAPKREPIKLVQNTIKEVSLRHAVNHHANRIESNPQSVIDTARLFEKYLSE